MINTFIHTHSSLENHTRFQLDQKGQSVCPFLDQNGPKTIPFWGGTYLYDLYIHHYHRNIQSHCGNRAWSGKKVAHSQFLGPDYLRVWNRQALKRMTWINCHLTFCGISKNNFEFHVFVTSSPVDRDQLIILLTSCQFERRALFLFCPFFFQCGRHNQASYSKSQKSFTDWHLYHFGNQIRGFYWVSDFNS